MLELQVQLLTAWMYAADSVRHRLQVMRRDERGEVTATTVLIVLLVAAAITAGGIIANKVISNANNVPDP